MKSYLLEHIHDVEAARRLLDAALPGQRDPWLLLARPDDPLAYVRIETVLDGEPNRHVCVDISGRHTHEDRRVLDFLHGIQRVLGGRVTDDS